MPIWIPLLLMETEPINPPSPAPTPSVEPVTNQPQNETALSPWESYLTQKAGSATEFLNRMEKKRAKGGLVLPDDGIKIRFADALSAKPDRVARLFQLLRACGSRDESIRRIVLGLAEAGIRKLGIVALPEPLDAGSFRAMVTAWLDGIPKRPLKARDLNLLLLLLQFGWQRQVLEAETAYGLVASAVARQVKGQPKKASVTLPVRTPIEALFAMPPVASALVGYLAYADVVRDETNRLNARIQSQTDDISRIQAECTHLNGKITALLEREASLKNEKAGLESTINRLNQEIVEVRDGYQHKLAEVRGRIRGTLQGQLSRWLQTALDASRSDPPWNQAIQERLEDALKLIERETRWLQPSA